MVLAVSVLTFDNSVGVPCVQICFAICVYVVFFLNSSLFFDYVFHVFFFFCLFFLLWFFWPLCPL